MSKPLTYVTDSDCSFYETSDSVLESSSSRFTDKNSNSSHYYDTSGFPKKNRISSKINDNYYDDDEDDDEDEDSDSSEEEIRTDHPPKPPVPLIPLSLKDEVGVLKMQNYADHDVWCEDDDIEPSAKFDPPKNQVPNLAKHSSDHKKEEKQLKLEKQENLDLLEKKKGKRKKKKETEILANELRDALKAVKLSQLLKEKHKRRKKTYSICLTYCKYESIRRVAARFGFKEVGDDEDWTLMWTDFSVNLDRVSIMKTYQKINHFPGMLEICRKDCLARNLNRMVKLFPKEYNICPKTWCFPSDYTDFQSFVRMRKHKTYILKPDNGCQGKGIWITRSPKEIKPVDNMVCQLYLSRPFLIDGYKFDIRLYVLVTSCDPLRIFVFKDGLVRFTTMPYSDPTHQNVDNVLMHLTNYSLQKNSDNFVADDEEAGTKRRITTINRWFKENGYDIEKIWGDVDDVVIKTIVSIHGILRHNYRTCFPNPSRVSNCFELLGFDIIFDRKLKPYVIEVNHSPSFHTDAKLDKEIKEALIWDTLHLANFGALDKRKIIEEEKRKVRERLFNRSNKRDSNRMTIKTREDTERELAKFLEEQERYESFHMGNFRRIYPTTGSEKYDKYFTQNGSLYQETTAFRNRAECASLFPKIQREEIRQKQERAEFFAKKPKPNRDARPESPGSRLRKKLPNRQSRSTNRIPGYMHEGLDLEFDSMYYSAVEELSSHRDVEAVEKLPYTAKEFHKKASNIKQVLYGSKQQPIVFDTNNKRDLITPEQKKMPPPLNLSDEPKKAKVTVKKKPVVKLKANVQEYVSSKSSGDKAMNIKENSIQRLSINTDKTNPKDQRQPIDTLKPQPIIDEEENDRWNALHQRENLIRGLGVLEMVHRMLQHTSGTMAIQPSNNVIMKNQPLGKVNHNHNAVDELRSRSGNGYYSSSSGYFSSGFINNSHYHSQPNVASSSISAASGPFAPITQSILEVSWRDAKVQKGGEQPDVKSNEQPVYPFAGFDGDQCSNKRDIKQRPKDSRKSLDSRKKKSNQSIKTKSKSDSLSHDLPSSINVFQSNPASPCVKYDAAASSASFNQNNHWHSNGSSHDQWRLPSIPSKGSSHLVQQSTNEWRQLCSHSSRKSSFSKWPTSGFLIINSIGRCTDRSKR